MSVRYVLKADPADDEEPASTPTEDELVGPTSNENPVLPTYIEPVRATFADTGSLVPSALLDSVPTIQYVVRVGWESVPANAFTLDASQLDSAKVLTAQFSSFLNLLQFGISEFGGTDGFADSFSALYADVSNDVRSIRVQRGRDDNLSDFEAGAAVVVLHDPTSKYSPLNKNSVLYPYVTPGRPIIIEMLLNGERHGIFRGFVRSIEHDPAQTVKTTTLQCQDLLLYLSRSKPVITYKASPITVGEAIGHVLDAVGWTDPNLRQLGYGQNLDGGFGPFTGSDSALSIIQGLVQVERGEFYHGRDGVVRYFYRQARFLREPGYLLDGAVAGAVPAADLTNIKNRAIVTKTGSGSQTAEDTNSIDNYGPSEVTLESAYINTPGDALSLAQLIVAQNKDPQPPIRAVEFVAEATYGRMFVATTMEIGDRIKVADSAANLDEREFFIEGISHEITPEKHVTGFTLSRVPSAKPIIFGTSRYISGELQSPSATVSPYTNDDTSSDIFTY